MAKLSTAHAAIDHAGLTGIPDLAGHLADASDAHDASAVSVLDSGANFTGTDVEAVLAELQDNIDAVAAGSGVDSGTSFPGSPSNNDLFYRTDRDLLYFYDGTRWLTVNEYQSDIWHHNASGLTADANVMGFPIIADGDTYLTTFFGTTFVSATAIWLVELWPITTGAAQGSMITSVTTSGDSAGAVVRKSATINALVPNTTFMLQVVFNETTGSASVLGAFSLRYRRVG